MQKSGLEWVCRLSGQPKRVAGRYARKLSLFAADLIGNRLSPDF
jgi:UDP-N-acetyl-D-mannosaminuronic acid transferase (WecB/TagA/CpsF family)